MAALLFLVTIALYWPATGFGFINFDDPNFVTSNIHVQGGLNWEAVKWAFQLNTGDYWHPLTWLSLMLDASLFGQGAAGFHFTNLAFHAANGVLLFLLLRLLTGALWRSAVVAALFALHPLRVESVVWVTERKDVLSGCFGLLALICYARYAQGRMQKPATLDTLHATRSTLHESTFYLLSLCFFTCGLMSKAMLVTWPFVMLLLDYWPLGRMQNAAPRGTLCAPRSTLLRLVAEKLPFFMLSGISCVLTYLTERGRQEGTGFVASPALLRLENALVAYASYLGKTFWPANLAMSYTRPDHWSWLEVGGPALVVAGVCLVALWLGRRRPYILVGWCWFLGTLIPVIGLTQGWGSFMADRFTYVPSVGVLMLTVWGVWELTRGWRDQAAVLSVAGGAAIVLCVALTRQQTGYWRDSEVLFRHAVEVTENNYLAHSNLGNVLGKKGQIDEAIREFQEAVRIKPGYFLAYINLGVVLGKKGQTDEAIRQFREAIRLNPDYIEAHYDLGVALGKKGQLDEAIRELQETIRLEPDHAQAHNDLGADLYRRGRTGEAVHEYQEAIRLKPDYAEAHYDLGIAFYQQRRAGEAIRQFQEALRIKPDFAAARRNLNAVLATEAHSSPPSGPSTDR